MELLEMIGEILNPGGVGRFNRNNNDNKSPNLMVMFFRIIVSSILMGLLFYYTQGESIKFKIIFWVSIFIYCVIAYFIIPEPDATNLGWLGGIIDNPFRMSDDINRMLVFILVFLYPGRFVAETLVQLSVSIRNMCK